MSHRSPAVLFVALVLAALTSATAYATDYSSTARNIIPSGQYGTVPVPPGADRQAKLYDGLTPLFDDIRRGHLFKFFKSERLGTAKQGPLRTERIPGRPRLKIVCDRYNVPHIYGKTSDDVTFGAGYAVARDRALLLSGLQKRLGAKRGRSVWDDLRQRQDPETAVTVDGRFPYAPAPSRKRRRGNVVPDNGSFQPSIGASASAALGTPPPQASNVLMVGGKRSRTGRPLMVGGPQIGYSYPGLTLEMDLHGPGWQARGATSVPFPGYMLIGRGEDFAYTLTSAGADIIDDYVETLCRGSRTRYVYKGRCRKMTTFNAGQLSAGGGEPARQVSFNRTVHGPVIGYARVSGRRVAIARKRSSYGRDVVDQLFYRDLTRGKVNSARSFIKAAAQTPQTFNSFYIDHRNIAMYTSGRLPIRPRAVDSGLPVDGRGRFEWRGFASPRAHPRGINPKNGTIVNWNNKPARGFPGADDQFGYGSVERVDLLNRGVAKRRRHSLQSLVGAMNAAATQDVRAIRTVPLLARVLRTRMLGLLERWRARRQPTRSHAARTAREGQAAQPLLRARKPQALSAVAVGGAGSRRREAGGRPGSRPDRLAL